MVINYAMAVDPLGIVNPIIHVQLSKNCMESEIPKYNVTAIDD